MKVLLSIGVSVILYASAGSASAQPNAAADIGGVRHSPTPMSVSPGDLQPLERWFHQKGNYSVPAAPADGSWTHPGQRVGLLGHVSWRYFHGGVTLYSCASRGSPNRFTSHDSGCEGQIPSAYLPVHGYAASTQLPGTVPLYRCRHTMGDGWTDHFDSLDAGCEGARHAVNEGVLGYIWQ